MKTDELIKAKKELAKLQKTLGKEMAQGKFRDEKKIGQLKSDIKEKKYLIGNISKNMIAGE